MSELGHNGGPAIDWREYGGFIAEARDSRAHPIIGYGKQVKPCDEDRGFCYSINEAWRDLIHECRFKDGYVVNGGRKMTIERGSLVGAVSWLAHRWNWTPKTVRGFLERLENDGMIQRELPGIESGQQKGKQAQVIKVCNYSAFNALPPQEGQAQSQAAGEQGASRGQAEGNIYKEEQRNNETTQQAELEILPLPPKGGERKKLKIREVAKIAFDEWCELAQRIDLPVPRETSFNDARARDIFNRMRDHAGPEATADELLAIWRQALANVEKSSFLRFTRHGQTDLTFLCQRKSFTKLVEGGYGNGAHAYPKQENEWDRIDRVLGKPVDVDGDDLKLIEGTLA